MSSTNPTAKPGWWVDMAQSIPMSFLDCILRIAMTDEIITVDQARDIRQLAVEAINEYEAH